MTTPKATDGPADASKRTQNDQDPSKEPLYRRLWATIFGRKQVNASQKKDPTARRAVGMTGSWLLGLYVLVLGFLLVQNIYIVWPPFDSLDGVDCDAIVAANIVDATEISEDDRSSDAETTEGTAANATGAGAERETQGATGNEAGNAQREPAAGEADDRRQASRLCSAEIRVFFRVATLEDVTSGRRVLLIVILMGALGSWIHIASSYAKFVGNRTLVLSWLPWYVVRPLIGSALAVVFYIVMRAGFVSDVSGSGNTFYSMAAAAGLVGLFTAIATEKLREVFVALFAPRSADRDTLEGNPTPRIDGIEPSDVFLDDDQTVVLNGAGFTSDSKVLVGGLEHEFTLKGETQIELTLSVDELSKGPEISIAVRNPEPGGGNAVPAKLIVKR